ncbi:MAG: Hpt domain-containing protein [Planctomycetota bacterium]|jgi:HPt (histidine-containing phosphotransfer) domain-containing protein
MEQKESIIANTGCPVYWWDVFGRIGDESIITEFAASFVKNGETLMLSLKSAVNAHSPEQIELYAHALKGSASNIGAFPLAKKAWIMERNASEKHLDGIDEQLIRVEQEYGFLKSLLERPDWIQRAKRAAEAGIA